jgi:hypothetical protein|tara:strand:+ start:560 stop:1003 length:444 start_codon:yes stop_codon:yes gene_type:complete
MNYSSPYLNFDFQKKLIADASDLGFNLNWMVSRGLCYERKVKKKIEFILKKRMKNEKSVYKLFKRVNNKKEMIQRREKYNKIREQEANKQPAIDICLATKKKFGGGFGIHVSDVLTEMSKMTVSEIRERVEDEMRGPCTPETSDEEC